MYRALVVRLRDQGDLRLLLGIAGSLGLTGTMLVMRGEGLGAIYLRSGIPVNATLCMQGSRLVGEKALSAMSGMEPRGATAVLVEGAVPGVDVGEAHSGAMKAPAAGEGLLDEWSRMVFDPVNMASMLLQASFIGARKYGSRAEMLSDMGRISTSIDPYYLYIRVACRGVVVKMLGMRGTLAAAMAEASGAEIYGSEALKQIDSCGGELEAHLYRVPYEALPPPPSPSCSSVEECVGRSIGVLLKRLGVEAETSVEVGGGECSIDVAVSKPRIALEKDVQEMIGRAVEEAAREALYTRILKPLRIRVAVRSAGRAQQPGGKHA